MSPPITSLQNPRVKDAVRLRDARHRGRAGRFPIDGARELVLAMRSGIVLEAAFVCQALCQSPESQTALQLLDRTDAEVLPVSSHVFKKLAYGQRAEGILGVARTPHATLDELTDRLSSMPLVAVLEGIEKPGNVGAVLRSADGAGVSAVIVVDGGTDLYNPNAIRASLGTIFTVPVCAASADDAKAWLRGRGCQILASRVNAERDYAGADFRGPTALVLGSEAEGLSPAWSEPDVTTIRLPMHGAADSLNVSAAAAVLFYEALRQRGHVE